MFKESGSTVNVSAISLTVGYPEVRLSLHTEIIICSSASVAVYSSREKEMSKTAEKLEYLYESP